MDMTPHQSRSINCKLPRCQAHQRRFIRKHNFAIPYNVFNVFPGDLFSYFMLECEQDSSIMTFKPSTSWTCLSYYFSLICAAIERINIWCATAIECVAQTYFVFDVNFHAQPFKTDLSQYLRSFRNFPSFEPRGRQRSVGWWSPQAFL